MTAGIPVVATAAGAVPEVVGDAAEVVPVGDIEALAAAMGTVLTDDERRRELVGLGHRNIERYSWDATANGMVELYERAVQARGGLGPAVDGGRPPRPASAHGAAHRTGRSPGRRPRRAGHGARRGAQLQRRRRRRALRRGAVRGAADHLDADGPPLDLEVVVVDNASTDGSAEALTARFADLVLVHNPVNTGFPANNLALRDLEGIRYVALVNPDCVRRARVARPAGAVPGRRRRDRRRLPAHALRGPLRRRRDHVTHVIARRRRHPPARACTSAGATVEGRDVWAGVRVAGVDFGQEQGPDGMFRWTGDRTVLRIPVPSTGSVPAAVDLTVTSVLGERSATFRSGDAVIEVEVGTTAQFVSVPLAAPPIDLVNNAGSLVFDDGYGADRRTSTRSVRTSAEARDVFAFTGGAVAVPPGLPRRGRAPRQAVLPLLRGHGPLVAGHRAGVALPVRPRLGRAAPALRHRRGGLADRGVLQRAQPPDDAHQERPGAARRPRDPGVRRLDRRRRSSGSVPGSRVAGVDR